MTYTFPKREHHVPDEAIDRESTAAVFEVGVMVWTIFPLTILMICLSQGLYAQSLFLAVLIIAAHSIFWMVRREIGP